MTVVVVKLLVHTAEEIVQGVLQTMVDMMGIARTIGTILVVVMSVTVVIVVATGTVL